MSDISNQEVQQPPIPGAAPTPPPPIPNQKTVDPPALKRRNRSPQSKTTYYDRFPHKPRPNSNLIHVFWAIAHDHRALAIHERRNVVYPGKKAGLIDSAPKDELGVKLNRSGDTSRCGFVLTEKGERYYQEHVVPVLPDQFVSSAPIPPSSKARKQDPDPAELKELKTA